jgi:DNA-binding NtrC family response regulator/Tfp pilus assembly protein PilF
VTCPACRARAPKGARFCPACGAPLAAPAPLDLGEAQRSFHRGDYAAALAALKKVPESAQSLAWRGHAQFFSGQEAEAEQSYRRALALEPGLWEAAYQLASLDFTRGRYEDAAQGFGRLPPAPKSLEGHPLAALFGGEPSKAQAAACLYLGLSLKELGREPEAEDRLSDAIRLDGQNPLPYGVLGDLLLAQGRHAEAAARYQSALDKVQDPASLAALRNDLGVAYFRSGDLEKAAEAFKAVLKHLPDDTNAMHNLGMLYLKQGLGEELRQDLREFLKADKAEQLLLGLTRSLVAGARGQALEPGSFGLVGQSQALRDVVDLVGRAAASDANVLLLGENGTGKELVARAIHQASPRSAGPFVAVNCAALPENLLESELFGYEKGAFTGAQAAKLGRFELAAGGTLFLDEIGDLQPSLQVKLLRAVQEKSFERLGGTRSLRSDFRLVAATHRDLRRDVVEGRFREDLFYRLFVIPIFLPPLRERPEDIGPLAMHFLQRQAARSGRRFRRLTQGAMNRLLAHRWPGNVRELENLIERAVAMHDGEELGESQLLFGLEAASALEAPPAAAKPADTVAAGPALKPTERAERQAILDQWLASGRRADSAAKELGMSKATFYRKFEKYGLKSHN